MSFNLEGRVPAYETPDKRIQFVVNERDAPDAYDIIIGGKDHLYIPSRTLSDLTSPFTSTIDMMRILDAVSNRTATPTLELAGISPTSMHIALLQLRIAVQEREIDYHISRGI